MEKPHALMLLQRALGDSKAMLRPGQWEAIDALVNHRRKLLVVERTGWGRLVADGKHTGRFRDELVDAAAEMILDRWRPEPFPEWVTCVPSLRHPELVPDFSKRLAARLGLPFKDVVSKLKDNEPQRLQNNSWHQCRNLDGAFAIKKGAAGTPVLLADDMVDSRWTVTVIAALLRQAGSGPVFPVALATTFANG